MRGRCGIPAIRGLNNHATIELFNPAQRDHDDDLSDCRGIWVFSLTQLKIDLFPDLSFPVIAVITNYRGVGPEDMKTW